MDGKAPIVRLAQYRYADAGKCACCDAPAEVWYRTELIADGRLAVAARYCAEHDPDTHPGAAQTLKEITLADVARLSRGRVKTAARIARRCQELAKRCGRLSARYQGASSLTHTYRLWEAIYEDRAQTLLRLAAMEKKTPYYESKEVS